jgi:outer membrane assembly lipoprotein YfiO
MRRMHVSLARSWKRLLGGLSVLGTLSLGAGCSPVPDLGQTTAEDSYQIAVDAAARGDYLLAVEAFRRVTAQEPLGEFADDALLGLADAHRVTKDFASADAEYRQVVTDYPRSPLVPEAEYKLGLSMSEQSLPASLDQEMTRTAITQFERFIADYPESPLVSDARAKVADLRSRLAKKDYESAMLYFTLGSPEAGRIYLESVASGYPDTEWARKALLEEARSFAREGAGESAATAYRRLLDLYPDTEEAGIAAAEIGPQKP